MFPTLFHFGHVSLPTFGALAALGLMLALWLSERTAGLAGVDAAKLWDAGIFAVIAAFCLSFRSVAEESASVLRCIIS